ncbi:hypothetical protein GCM10009868_36430 [Terrabacter aerolatus]|uniref:Uncharacterized protein n=1 Tax=Terrabacter aerolatus TaxID=422442 RepID=A0A512CVZ6_9MICO|nr:hypothetical protein TAE01_01840 [Terrabacter aerolatus]
MRRPVCLLLTTGALLLVAGLVWPTDRLVVESPGGAVEPLVDIWVWGRVRPRSESMSVSADGSYVAPTLLVVSTLVAVAAAALWFGWRRGGDTGRRRPGVLAALGVGVALATAVVGLGSGDAAFGWVSMGGEPVPVRTVAVFPLAALALWAVALVVMVVAMLRRGGRPTGDEAVPVGPAPA